MSTYALVTPARNELVNLERLAGAVVAQEQLPLAWVIVDDGSDDGTAELAARLAGEHPWIHVVSEVATGHEVATGRRRGRPLDAFRRGVRALPAPPDVVVKVDADTSFDRDYFRRVVEHFDAEPDLGIAGGACYEIEDGEWVRRKVIATHPRGASRAYRWELIGDVLALEPKMGWDGLDEAQAKLRGFRSAVLLELGFRHHRATGARERNRVKHYLAQGRAAWYMGYRPSYIVLRSAYRGVREPSALAMAGAYVAEAFRRADRCPYPELVEQVRSEQRLRRVIKQGAPP